MKQEESESEKPDPHRDAFGEFIDDFITESDRAAVILGAAKLDGFLLAILERHLLPHPGTRDELLENDNPLAPFSARIQICHRLGLIDDQFTKLLHLLRRLRNEFAHQVSQKSLSTGAARDRVLALAEPFAKAPFFDSVLIIISSRTNRKKEDPGVIFRAVLTLFYLELHGIRKKAKPIERSKEDIFGFVAKLPRIQLPEGILPK
jgi:hypothetical protein